MKTQLTFLALIASAVLGFSAEKPRDLTGAEVKAFKGNIGKVVTLRGRLENGKEGLCLWDAVPNVMAFYVIPDMPAKGTYVYPDSWETLIHKQVELTGELKFRSFNRANAAPLMQAPPDYYYMVLQSTRIKAIEKR